mgnify:CR=1 FL=1
MITNIYLVRHGRSEAADKGIVQGAGLEIPLTLEGMDQAKDVAKKLKDFKFDRIFSSTARRARDTAEFIREYHTEVPFSELPELVERSKGLGEGLTKEEFASRWPNVIADWSRDIDARPEGGENYEDVEKRVMPMLSKHVKEYEGGSLLYVGHGNVFRVIIGSLLSVPYSMRARIEVDYCKLTVLESESDSKRWYIKSINGNIGDN